MDEDQARCPQCGAAVRPSARFCVTCGIRLPDLSSANRQPSEPSTGWRPREDDAWVAQAPPTSPESDDVVQDVDSTDPLTEPTTEPIEATEPATPDEPARDDDEIERSDPVIEPLKSSGWENWGSVSDDVIPMPPVETPADEIEEPASLDDSASDTPIDAGNETEAAADEERDSRPGTPAEETAPIIVAEDDELDVDLELELELDELAEQDDDSAEFEPAGWTEVEEELAHADSDFADQALSISATEPDPVEQPREVSSTQVSASLDRAYALLSELQQLLPGLATPAYDAPPADTAPAAASVDLIAIRDEAISAKGDISFDNFQSLREIITEAVSRPRDIEVVLRLSQRADDIDALLKERDRLRDALDQVIARLSE